MENKKSLIVGGVIAVLLIVGALGYDAYTFPNHPTIKGRVVQVSDTAWALVNQPLDLGLTITMDGLPVALQQAGSTVECNVVIMDEREGNPGVDGYAVVENCEQR